MIRDGWFEDTIGEDVPVIVRWGGYYQRARTTGLPENCHPAEGEMDIDIELMGEWPEGLTKKEYDEWVAQANQRLTERAWEQFYDQEDDKHDD